MYTSLSLDSALKNRGTPGNCNWIFFSEMAPTIGNEGGPFHRVRDKRLVRQVLSAQHQPHHWMPMDITATECKLMEVKKFSAEFHEIDVK